MTDIIFEPIWYGKRIDGLCESCNKNRVNIRMMWHKGKAVGRMCKVCRKRHVFGECDEKSMQNVQKRI